MDQLTENKAETRRRRRRKTQEEEAEVKKQRRKEVQRRTTKDKDEDEKDEDEEGGGRRGKVGEKRKGREMRVRACVWRDSRGKRKRDRETSRREETQRRKASAPRATCSSRCLHFHASLAKPPQTAKGVDPQAVSVPDTTPAAT